MLELFPEGFEERDLSDGVELAAYTDAGGEERLWAAFGTITADAVPGGWEERWRDFHRPITIGRLWIGPPWEDAPAEGTTVVIDPGRAFGTGGHATTRLCLELLGELEPSSLLDVGCGSGVLALAASRLGFAPVLAVDHEETAVEAAKRNARSNGIELDVRLVDALGGVLPKAEIVVANVSSSFLCEIRPHPATRAVIGSGYLEPERPELAGFAAKKRRIADGWAADLFLREE
jgi:ribosomal protein L11 methyltransferase